MLLHIRSHKQKRNHWTTLYPEKISFTMHSDCNRIFYTLLHLCYSIRAKRLTVCCLCECRAAEERMLMGSRRRTWQMGVVEGKARADQPDRPAASTRVIAEPCVPYRAGAKALSPLFSSIPLSAIELGSLSPVSLRFSSLSSRRYSSPSLCPYLHISAPPPPHFSLYHTSFAPDNTSASTPIHKLCHHDAHRW